MTRAGWFRFVSALTILLATAIVLQVRGRNEVYPPRLPLAALPHEFGAWSSTDLAIPKDELDVLGQGDFLLRGYQNTQNYEPYVGVFIAYFPSQRAGDTIHSPKHCLPGAGWLPVENRRVRLAFDDAKPFNANRYVIAKGTDRQVVLYWYLAHGRKVASEYWAKFYLVADAMRLNRSDGALIRLTTPLIPGESADVAQHRLVSLAKLMTPEMNKYIPH